MTTKFNMQNSKKAVNKLRGNWLLKATEAAGHNPKSSQRELAAKALEQWRNRAKNPRITNLDDVLRRKY
jgi:hypothetical protein